MSKEIEEIEAIEAEERHMFRFLIRFVVLVGVLYVAGRFLAQKKNEYADLTESEARDKLMETMGPRVGDDTANEIADQVIPKLKDRGLIKSDLEAAADDVGEAAEDKAEDDADSVADAVDSVVKD